jgi:RNA polymerase sigma-70 factor (ECF subfamily)
MIEPLALKLAGVKRGRGSHTGALMNSSEDLIIRARAGEQEAFRLIFERYARPILTFIHNLVGERDLAEELTQETFVRAYQNLGRIRDDTKIATWLFGIGKNVAREALRSKWRANEELHQEANLSLEDTKVSSPSDMVLGKELNAAIRQGLGSLAEDQRVVFILRVFQQYRYDEIADITGFSVAKVKIDLHRARRELRKRIRPFLETAK